MAKKIIKYGLVFLEAATTGEKSFYKVRIEEEYPNSYEIKYVKRVAGKPLRINQFVFNKDKITNIIEKKYNWFQYIWIKFFEISTVH